MRRFANGLVERAHSWPPGVRSSPARPREEAMPSLQVSVPGQATTSTIVPAPGFAQADGLQFVVQIDGLVVRNPAAARCSARRWCAHVPPAYRAGDVGQRAHLVRCQIAQRAA